MYQEIYYKVKEFLLKKVNPSFIIIFGSFAKETTHKTSDIDIAFYSTEKFTSYDLFMFAQELAEILKIEVDLVNITEVSTVFKAQIFTTGKVIYCNDDTLRMKINMQALSMYARLNEERKKILDQIKESGAIYEK